MVPRNNSAEPVRRRQRGSRLYLLLETVSGHSGEVARLIRLNPGVVSVDLVEGKPDVIAVMEAEDRQELAHQLMRVISCVENTIEDARILPTRDGSNY